MVAVAAILTGSSFDRRTSDGISDAGAAVSLVQAARLPRLGKKLSKLNATLDQFFAEIYKAADAAQPGSSTPGQVDEERVRSASQTLLALHAVISEIYQRARTRDLTNCSRFGIAANLERARVHSERLAGLADWLEMLTNPSDYEAELQEGRNEFSRGEFVKFA
ncbi:MAG: hypothetical protein ACRD17_14625 [Terriglobales bacterium]